MTKDDILDEIRRTAAENGGAALGIKSFERQTGIRQEDWLGVYWPRWGDAVREAGLQANALNPRIEDDHYLKQYALLTRQLGRIPVKADLQLAKRRESTFPSVPAFMDRFGSYATIRSRVYAWCSTQSDFSDVLSLLCHAAQPARPASSPRAVEAELGFVYLVKHGSRAEFKIGRTLNPIRREGEMRLQLPEKVKPIHYIQTDDPAGIEAYWHTRFAAKRKEGEWFALTLDDVRAFKKWRRIS